MSSEFCRRKHWLAESSQRFLPLQSKVAVQCADKWTQRKLVGGQRSLSAATTAQLMYSPSCQADPEGAALLVRKWYGNGQPLERLEFCPPQGPQDRRAATFLDRQSRAYIRMLDEFYRTAFGSAASLTHLKLRACRKWSAAVQLPRGMRFEKLEHVDVCIEALRLMVSNLTPNDTKPWRKQADEHSESAVPALCPEAHTLQLTHSRFGQLGLNGRREDSYCRKLQLSANFPKVRDFETPEAMMYFLGADGSWSDRVFDNIAVSNFRIGVSTLPLLLARQTLDLCIQLWMFAPWAIERLAAELTRQLAGSQAKRVHILFECDTNQVTFDDTAPQPPTLYAEFITLVADLLDAHGEHVDIALEGGEIVVRDAQDVFGTAELQAKFQKVLLHLTTPRTQASNDVPPPWPSTFCERFDRAKQEKRLAYSARRLPRRLVPPVPLPGITSGGVQIECHVTGVLHGFDLLFTTPNAQTLTVCVSSEIEQPAESRIEPLLQIVARRPVVSPRALSVGTMSVQSKQLPLSTTNSAPRSHGLAMDAGKLGLHLGDGGPGTDRRRDPLHKLLDREGFGLQSTEVRLLERVDTPVGGTCDECLALQFARHQFPTVLREVPVLFCRSVANLVQLAQHVTYAPSKAQHVLNMFRKTATVCVEEAPASRDHVVALRRSVAVALPGLRELQLTCTDESAGRETADRRREALGLRGDQILTLLCVSDSFW